MVMLAMAAPTSTDEYSAVFSSGPSSAASRIRRSGVVRVAVAALEHTGDGGERLVAAQPDDEPHRLAVTPRRRPSRGLEQGGHLLARHDRVRVEGARAPARGDVGVNRHRVSARRVVACSCAALVGGLLLLAQALVGGFLDHILTLPAE